MERQTEAATWDVLLKEVFLKCSQNSQENTCARVLFLIKLHAVTAALLQKRLYVVQVFSSEFDEVFKKTFLNRTLAVAASGQNYNCYWLIDIWWYIQAKKLSMTALDFFISFYWRL